MANGSVFEALGTIGRGTGTVTTVDLSANQTSGVFSVAGSRFNLSFQLAIVSGTPNGSFFVDVSNDRRCNDATFSSSAVWTALPAVVFTSGLNNGNANCMVTLQNGACWARCRWVSLDNSAGQGWAMGHGVTL